MNKQRKTIGVIGCGFVGKAIVEYFKTHFNVVARDVSYEQMFTHVDGRIESKFMSVEDKNNYDRINSCDLVVVCVPTEMQKDGKVDISIVEEMVSKLTNADLILIKSTVPPGTTDYLSKKYSMPLAFSPEFLGESSYATHWWKGYAHPTDLTKHSFIIFGGERFIVSDIVEFFKVISGPSCKYMCTDAKTAEFVKYFENIAGAMKVAFCNEMYEAANVFGIDYNEARELFLLDNRFFDPNHTLVFKDKRGFSGKCYPKDLIGFIRALESSGYVSKLLRGIWNRNIEFLKKNDDVPPWVGRIGEV
jgi:nucleotide sugar dehydrogenase